MMTEIIKSIPAWRTLRHSAIFKHKSVGFVPTMGALHSGHQSLLERCRQENELAVLSIFVNPTQFDEQHDFAHYPQTLEADIAVAKQIGIDYVLLPQTREMYADNYQYVITENNLSQQLCGQFRAKHFDGVLTIVMKLLQLVQPHKAYFGEKDYQQYLLVKGMIETFFLDVDIVVCATVRDLDGLAFSSRNQHLTSSERALAAEFPKLLKTSLNLNEIKSNLEHLGFKVDYIEDIANRRYAAVRLGKVRLIDNFPL